jgi:hypothetical protein
MHSDRSNAILRPMIRTSWLGVTAVVLAAVPSTSAQSDPEPATSAQTAGVWFGAAAGIGTTRAACPICSSGLDLAPAAQLRVGGTWSESIRFGLEASGWTNNDAEQGVRDIFVTVGAVLYWYPLPRRPYYFKAGLGPAFYRVQDSDVDPMGEPDPPIRSTAVAGHFGIGYDVGLAGLLFSPFFTFTGTLYGSLSQDDTRITDASVTFMQLGIGVAVR